MKEYSITKGDIATEVYRFTANAAVQRGDANAVATEDNADIINIFVEDGEKLLEKALGRYSAGELKYNMPDHWPDRSADINAHADTFLKNYVLAKWYELNGTGERFINAANEALECIALLLSKRMKIIDKTE